MRKNFTVLLLVMFFCLLKVNAFTDYSYRINKNNKPVVNVSGKNLYVNTYVNCNIEGNASKLNIPIEEASASFLNDVLYVSIKRSEINDALKSSNCNNVYEYLGIDADFLDINSSKKYYYFNQSGPEVSEYTMTLAEMDYFFKNYNFLNVISSSVPLIGLKGGEKQSSIGGGYILFESDDNSVNYEQYPTEYTIDQIDMTDAPIINISKSKVVVSVVEDAVMDLGNVNEIISAEGTVTENGDVVLDQNIEINNFYGEYFEANKLKYSWTLYDENGNPKEIDIDTLIKFDDSENANNIYGIIDSKFENIEDRVKIISFEHEGELGGKANVSLYVGDKFEAGSVVTIYYYNSENKKLENPDFVLENENMDSYNVLVDNSGYISIQLTHCSEYVVVDKEVATEVKEKIEEKPQEPIVHPIEPSKTKNIIMYSCILVFTLIIVVVIFIIKAKNKNKSA